ncbi:MAG: orotidine-5'-phosphate decarboxylase, partial [Acidobacteriota bacterium]
VMGAPYPEELTWARKAAGEDMVFLVPGVGVQGGELKSVLKNGLNSKGEGLIINSSRGIIFADDARASAIRLRDEINNYRKGK